MSLPKVFQNTKINLEKNDEIIIPDVDIYDKINKIFLSKNYMYKLKVNILLKDGYKNYTIIGRNKYYIITIDNELIPIKDILDINEIRET